MIPENKPNESITTRKQNLKKKKERRRSRGRIGKRTKQMVEVAKERIRILLSLAEQECIFKKNFTMARKYIQLARNLGMRYNIRIEKDFKHKFCRSCNTFLGSTHTSRIRCQAGRIIILCKYCGRIRRIPIH